MRYRCDAQFQEQQPPLRGGKWFGPKAEPKIKGRNSKVNKALLREDTHHNTCNAT